MNIVVTGGAGFIGSHLIDRLLENSHRVTNIDNFDSFYQEEVKRHNIKRHFEYSSYELCEADVRNREELDAIVPDDTDVIIHLASKVAVRYSIDNPIAYQQTNVNGTQNMLEVARQKDIRQFIFASSSSVYGTNPNVPWRESDHVLQPISPYASTKVSGELLGHVYSHLYDIRFLALRFFTVYGPRQRPDLAIHKFRKLMSEGKAITLFGDGSTRRDYTYVQDIVDGIVAAISYKGSRYEIINLGNNRTVTLTQLVQSLEKATGMEAKKEYGPEQPGDVKQTWASIEKAKKLLNYNPDFSLNEGLSKFEVWFKNQ